MPDPATHEEGYEDVCEECEARGVVDDCPPCVAQMQNEINELRVELDKVKSAAATKSRRAPISGRQQEILVVMGRSHALGLVDFSAQGLKDMEIEGSLGTVGVALKGLVTRGLVEVTQAARKQGNQKARYKITKLGLAAVRRSL